MLVLGVDRVPGEYVLALLETSGRGCRLVGSWSVADGPSEQRAQLLRDAIAEHCPRPPDAVATALDERCLTHRILRLPFSDPGRLSATVPFELESLVPFDLENAVTTFTVIGRSNGTTEVLAALAPREDLARHLEEMSSAGLDPAVVDVGAIAVTGLLALGGDELLVLEARPGGAVALLRDHRLAGLHVLDAEAPPELAAEARWLALALSGDGPLPPVVDAAGANGVVSSLGADLGVVQRPLAQALPPWAAGVHPRALRALALAARAAGLVGMGLNFRTGEFRYHAPSEEAQRQLRLTAICAGVALVLGIASYGVVLAERRSELQALREQIHQAASAIVPDASPGTERVRLEGAVEALDRRRAMLGGAGSGRPPMLELLRQIDKAVPEGVEFEIDDFGIDGDEIRLHARTASYESVDVLKRSLDAIPGVEDPDVHDVKTGIDGRIEFRASLHLRPQGSS